MWRSYDVLKNELALLKRRLFVATAERVMSLIAMARLHQLEPEQYLRDIIRVLPFWPRERFLELAPKLWAATRARIDARQLAAEVGSLDVPPRAASSAEQQPAGMP